MSPENVRPVRPQSTEAEFPLEASDSTVQSLVRLLHETKLVLEVAIETQLVVRGDKRAEVFVGAPLRKVFQASDDAIDRVVNDCVATGTASALWLVPSEDSNGTWYDLLFSKVDDKRIAVVATDVTDAEHVRADLVGQAAAISRSQAVIEFDLEGFVLNANANFLDLLEYELDEIQGQHHRIFCDPAYVATAEYRDFWKKLGAGEFSSDVFKRITKSGKEVWIQASYNPVFDRQGRPTKVIKYAFDVTEQRQRSAHFEGMVQAIERSQAVIEFDLNGNILTANENFLDAVGYRLDQIKGQHHRIFCDDEFVKSSDYAEFWRSLGRGEFKSGEFKRKKADGEEIWLQATYNPIFDAEGRPLTIVKFASDITNDKRRNAEFEAKVNAVSRSQAVVEFDLDGNVVDANENFLGTMGYSLREIVGQHHSMFVRPEEVATKDYANFWLRLRKGEIFGGRFQRVGKYDRPVWIRGAYNPIIDMNGNVVRVVKYAYDITETVELEQRIISKSAQMSVLVEELTESIGSVNGSAQKARDLANDTQKHAEHGFKSLTEAQNSISQIQSSTDEIANSVQLIQDLARQTNLLAFNASIEASRAGEHGVGFSFVAAEVRSLAERSAQVTADIVRLIGESTHRVAKGSEISSEARSAFDKILEGATGTNESIKSIAELTVQQQKTSDQVSGLLGELVVADEKA